MGAVRRDTDHDLSVFPQGERRHVERLEEGVPSWLGQRVGTSDEVAGSAHALGEIIPGSEVLDIPNRDHMRAVGDKVYKSGVAEFLSSRR